MFYISTYLPRLNKTAKLKEFTNKHYFDLAKFYYNNDLQGISNFFDNTIQDLIINKELYCELTCIEKFCIWLNLFYNCMHDDLSVFCKSLNDSVNVKILTLLSNIESLNSVEEKEIKVNDIIITLNAPRSLYIDSADSIFNNVIYSIKADGKNYYFENFTHDEKVLFFESLPVELFNVFIDYYKSLEEYSVDIMPSSDTMSFDPIDISITNGSMFAFLKSLFQTELKSHYNNALIFTKQFEGNYETYFNITMKDFLALYTVYQSNVKNEKNDLN
jgi:hypothetical protein